MCTLLANFYLSLCVKFHISWFWVLILDAEGPYWVLISQKMGLYWVHVNVKAWGSLLVLEAVKSTRIPVYIFKTLCFQLLTLPCNANLFRKSDRQKLKNRQTVLSSPDSPSLADSFKNP